MNNIKKKALSKKDLFYYNRFKTSNLIISYNSSPSTELLDRISVVFMFKCLFGECC